MYLVASLFFPINVERIRAWTEVELLTSEEYFSSDSKVHQTVQLLSRNKT